MADEVGCFCKSCIEAPESPCQTCMDNYCAGKNPCPACVDNPHCPCCETGTGCCVVAGGGCSEPDGICIQRPNPCCDYDKFEGCCIKPPWADGYRGCACCAREDGCCTRPSNRPWARWELALFIVGCLLFVAGLGMLVTWVSNGLFIAGNLLTFITLMVLPAYYATRYIAIRRRKLGKETDTVIGPAPKAAANLKPIAAPVHVAPVTVPAVRPPAPAPPFLDTAPGPSRSSAPAAAAAVAWSANTAGTPPIVLLSGASLSRCDAPGCTPDPAAQPGAGVRCAASHFTCVACLAKQASDPLDTRRGRWFEIACGRCGEPEPERS